MEKLTNNFGGKLNEAISNISIQTTMAPSMERAGTSSNINYDPVTPSQSIDSYETSKDKISEFLKNHENDLKSIFGYIESLGEPKSLYVFLDALNEKDRAQWKNQMSASLKNEFRDYLSLVSVGNYDLNANLRATATQLYKNLSLLSHDPELLKKQSLKAKVSKLDKMSLAHFIESADEREFGFLTQLSDPVQFSSVLNSYPHLLKKFTKIPKVSFSVSEMDIFSKRIEEHLNNQKASIQEDVSLASYLPPQLEAELNQKMGIEQNSFDLLSSDQQSSLLPFAQSLNINQLAAFMAILPEKYKTQIMNNLPDIKAQQITRRGINITDESFKLKHQFLTSRSGSLQ
jgi:hypothetical protein